MQRLQALAPHLAPAALAFLAAVLVWQDGAYDRVTWAAAAVLVWWVLGFGAAVGVWRPAGVTRAALAVGGLFSALALLSLASAAWTSSDEKAVLEAGRVALYAGVFALGALALAPRTAPRLANALGAAVAAVGVLSLTSRLFPGGLGDRGLGNALPDAAMRLSFPVGYWNGLAVLLAFAFPLLLGAATRGSTLLRVAAVTPLPALAAVLYLTSSRSGVAAALLGIVALLVLTDRRVAASAALFSVGIGASIAVAALLARDELVDGPLGPEASAQGRSAALLILLACAVAAALQLGFCKAFAGDARLPRPYGRVVAVALVVTVCGALVASGPVDRIRAFTVSPAESEGFEEENFTREHLFSGAGSGRWQFWGAAADQFQSDPILGGGAGSYEAWWAEHGSFAYALRDAHSLYAEMLGELGIVGFLLVVGALGGGLAAAVVITLRGGTMRAGLAGATGAFAAFCAAAGLDWIWELPGVTAVALLLLGGLLGQGSQPARAPTSRPSWPVVSAALAACAAVLALEASIFFAAERVEASRQAAARGALAAAADRAAAAAVVQPWAATPRLQQALVAQLAGELPDARTWIQEAIERDPSDWRLRVVAAGIERAAGRPDRARAQLREAKRLNPRSSLVDGLSAR